MRKDISSGNDLKSAFCCFDSELNDMDLFVVWRDLFSCFGRPSRIGSITSAEGNTGMAPDWNAGLSCGRSESEVASR